MRYRFTRGQINTIEQTFHGDEYDLAFFRSCIVDSTSTMTIVDAPYTMWQYVFVELERAGISAKGRKARGIPMRVVSALTAVRRAMGGEERHPARKGIGMIGFHFEYLPAWERPDGTYDPFPNGGTFWMLAPEHMGTADQQFTVWSRRRPEECLEQRLAAESLHLRFHGRKLK